ncbi:unnamed protein product [Oikopleura dioica]|uniref:Uncharacterized protein n=1 Tax=Oikopleura dioica TaxID=34765 RepID=E4YMM5_OIKDI|nr:unnamed protein product [Oikopleura dioica]
MNRKSVRKSIPTFVKVKPIPSPDFAFEKLQIAPRESLSKLSNEASNCANCQKYKAEIKKLRSLKKVNESFFTPSVIVNDIGTMTPPMVKLPVIKMQSTKKNESSRRSNFWPFSKNIKNKSRRRRTVSTPDLGIREAEILSNSSSVLDLLPHVGQQKSKISFGKSRIPVLKK